MHRAIWFWFFVTVWTLPLAVAYFFLALLPRFLASFRERALSGVLGVWSSFILLASGVRSQCAGTDLVPQGPLVLVANHTSWLDAWFILKHVRRPVRFASKRVFFFIPIFGWAMALAGHVSLTRGNREKDIRALEKVKARLIRDRICIIWFPEGTRSATGELQPFKKGVFHFVLDLKLPVVPVVIHGAHRLMPRTRWSPTPGVVTGEALSPISTDGLTVADKDRFLNDLESRFRSRLEAS